MRTIEVTYIDNDDGGQYITNDGKMKWTNEHIFGADWTDIEGQQNALVQATSRGTLNEVVELSDGSDSVIYASLRDVVSCDCVDVLACHTFMEKVYQSCSEYYRRWRLVTYYINVGYEITFCGRNITVLEINSSTYQVRSIDGRGIREMTIQEALEKINFFKITKTQL